MWGDLDIISCIWRYEVSIWSPMQVNWCDRAIAVSRFDELSACSVRDFPLASKDGPILGLAALIGCPLSFPSELWIQSLLPVFHDVSSISILYELFLQTKHLIAEKGNSKINSGKNLPNLFWLL